MSRPLPRTVAAALIALLAATSVALTGAGSATAADGSIAGTVFRDFNANGVLDAAAVAGSGIATDIGLGGVTVTAYDADGAVGTTVSAGDGTYSIPVIGASDDTVRVEFTGLPAGYQPGAVATTASANGTSVQFVDLGATDVDFAVNAPEDYSNGAAPLATAIQWAGSPFASEGGTKGAEPAVAAVAYDDGFTVSTQPAGFPGRVTLATFGDVGAVSSEVYHPSSNSIFVSAVVKRQSGLGSLGIGGIYRITDVLGADGTASAAGSVEPWLDVRTLGIDVGTISTNEDRGISGHNVPSNDPEGFEQSAKAGIGDMVLSSDGQTLFFVNLFDKKLYALDVSNPDSPPTAFESFDLGLGDGERPWGLTLYRGELYVGYVETGEQGGVAQPGSSAADEGLEFHVMSAPLSTLSGWANVLTGDLGYDKGDVYQGVLAPQSQQWNTWTDTWTWAGGRVAEVNGGWQIYPQAVLSDLYFDEDGYLSLGFIDRTSLQGGNRNVASDPAVSGTNYETGASGDLLIAAPNTNGTFTLEDGGSVGTRLNGAGNDGEGPGGSEFYNDTHNLSAGTNHKEVTLGYLAGLRGTREMVSTSYDPLGGIRLSGLMWFDVDNGDPVAGYELNGDGGANGAGGNFQKGGGLGGISLLAAAAPIEVGNRVWFDADKNGVQDADETPIAGLTVQLIKDDVVIGETTTDANGEYYFSSDPASDFYVEDFEPNGGEYSIQFVKPSTGNLFTDDPIRGTVPWNVVAFTTGEDTSTAIGSNPDPATGLYTFTAGAPGENDHTIDAGFIIDTDPSVDIEKGDGSGTTITHDADTMAAGEAYAPGETREIVFVVENTGTEPLRNVVLTEDALSGAEVVGLEWTFPDDTTATATDVAGVLTASWAATVSGAAVWEPGDTITGRATLTLAAGEPAHVDRATVTAVGAQSGVPVEDEDPYNAFTGAIQIIKYNGDQADPVVTDGTDWIVPSKPLVSPAQDANTADRAVELKAGVANTVRWVVTNTGNTSLTHLELADVTGSGPSIVGDWTADLSPFGGPQAYSFVNDGPWDGLLPPGASFFAEGRLTLTTGEQHADTVTVIGQVVVPEVDLDGLPTGDPSLDDDGDPIVALRDGKPFSVTDNDPYHARVPGLLAFTGWSGGAAGVLALVLLGGGVLLFLRRRRRPVTAHSRH